MFLALIFPLIHLLALFMFFVFSPHNSCLSLARAQLAKGQKKKNSSCNIYSCLLHRKISSYPLFIKRVSLSLFIYHRFLAGFRLSVKRRATKINDCQQINAGN